MTAIMETPLFVGCWGQVGHYAWRPDGSHAWGTPEGCPWPHLDSEDNTPRRRDQGWAALEHRQGLTMLGVHDYSVDSRPGSRAVFVLAGTLTFDEAVAAATEAFPAVVKRIGTIQLAEDRTGLDSGRNEEGHRG